MRAPHAPRLLSTSAAAVAAAAAFAGWPPVAHAEGDSLNDTLSVRAVGQGEAVRATAVGASATSANPAGAALAKAYLVEGTYGFRPEDDATVAGASICDPTTARLAACAYYNYFSATPAGGERSLHDVGLTLALPVADKLALGATGRWVDYSESGSAADPDDHSRDGAFLLDAGAIFQLSPMFSLGAAGYNLIGADGDNFPRGFGAGLAFTPSERFTLGADGVWNLQVPEGESTGRYGVGGEFMATSDGGQQGYPLRAGYVYDAGDDRQFVTAGVGFVSLKVGLEVGLRQQVAGDGDELLVQVGLKIINP